MQRRCSGCGQGNLYSHSNERAEVQICGISLVSKTDMYIPGTTDYPFTAISLVHQAQTGIGKLPSGVGGSRTGYVFRLFVEFNLGGKQFRCTPRLGDSLGIRSKK
jgi:hypothetical protein